MLGFPMGFEVLDISGDVGIRAKGSDLKEVFVSAAEGMYSLITDIDKVDVKKHIKVTVASYSHEGLLVAWLNELIFYFDTYYFIGKRIVINELTQSKIDAVVEGEDFDPLRHEKRLLVKAATYHDLVLEDKGGLYQVDVIFDI
ncbi:MAG: archease [Nitrospirae bacterium]|nr:archease [Nitrospirota bacterium]